MPIGRAALIATFFCKADSPLASELWQRLTGEASGLALVRVSDDLYQNVRLRRRLTRSPILDDTRIIQLFLNEEEAAPRGWAVAFETLMRALSNLLDERGDLWGYSLCYQSAITAQEGDIEAQRSLLRKAFPDNEHTFAGEWPFGRLWLLARPQGDGLQASTMYVLLGPAEREEQAVREFLAVPEGIHPRLELSLHKACYHGRQYGPTSQDRVARGIQALQMATDALLTSPHGLAEAGREEQELDQLAGRYANLTSVTAHLRHLRNSVQINLRSLHAVVEEWGEPARSWWRLHEGPLGRVIEQLDYDLEYAQPTLEAARAAAEVLRARFAAAEARAESRTNLWLALVGLALAVGQIVDQDMANWLAGWSGLPSSVTLARALSMAVALALALAARYAWRRWLQPLWSRQRQP